jgi:DNA repair exonuclease SbcCD nuclease subunit
MWKNTMTEFTLITANDIHISDNGPRSRIDDFKTTVMEKISQIRLACIKLKADALIIAGDLYNLKNPAKNSHNLNQELIKEFRQFPCPILMIEGNHDLTANRLDSLPEQPLGVLFADGTLTQLRHEIIEKQGTKISLVGVPYIDGMDLSKLQLPDKDDCVAQICAMHIYAGPKAMMLYKEQIYGYDELCRFSPDVFVLGHYHIDQGIQQVMGKHFINLGSITRGTLSDEDISHTPQIGVIKISVDDRGNPSYNIKSIKLKVRPASEVFDLVRREKENKENKDIQMFVEKLASELTSQAIQNKSIEEVLNSMDMAKAVRDKVLYFISEAVTENA